MNQHKLVIPVLIEDAPMPRPDQVPEGLQGLSYLQAAPLRQDPDFATDTARLIDSIRRANERSAPKPPPTP